MKHRLAYNLLLTGILVFSMIAWLLAGFSVGIQMVPNPTAQLEQNIATAVIILSLIGLVIVNIMPLVRRRKSVPAGGVIQTIKPQSAKQKR